MFHSLVSLGIGSHEISHGFTEQHSNLSYFGQSGGINESFSDMAAQAAEYYIHHDNSWFIGSDILKNSCPLKAIRYMNEPSLDGNSIDNAENFTKNLDVHYSSGVYNKLFYLMATADGSDTLKAFGVMLKANMDYWTAKSTFNEGACGILYAAEDLNFPIDTIKAAMDVVKVDYALC
jgi:pseudolysin